MKNLKILRINKHYKQQDVAEALKIPTSTYATYEQNRATPNEDVLIKLADFFDCSIDYLLGHQTKDLIYASELTSQQAKMIEEIKQLNNDELHILEGVILRLKQEQEQPWLKN